MFDAVDGFDGFEDILQRIAQRIFAGFERQALVPHVLQGNHFVSNLLLRELLAGDGFVFEVIGAIGTAVHAVVRQVERSEHHNAVAVELLFNLFGQAEDAFGQIRLIAFE